MRVDCNIKNVLLLVIFTGIALSLSARGNRSHNTYYSEELKQLAIKVNIADVTDTLSDGLYFKNIFYNKKPLTIIVKGHEVKHIGFTLFSPEQRKIFSPIHCNFVERYALLLKSPMERVRTKKELMEQDKVIFRMGSFDVIEDIMEDTTLLVQYNCKNNINFFTWTKDGRAICELGYPSSYKLLLGMEMDELDSRLKSDVLKTKTISKDSIVEIERGNLTASITRDFFVKKGSSYYFAELNSDQYYQPFDREKNLYRLMYDDKYPHQSLANIMTSNILPNEFLLNIKQEVYGKKDSIYTIPLAKYISFCLNTGCKPYFCVIREKDGVMDCELIMCNEILKYNHIMRMKVGTMDIPNRKGIINARLDAYIPTNYLRNLFNEIKK